MIEEGQSGVADPGSSKQVIIENSLWLLFERITLMAGGLLLSVIFARQLGADDFGRYNFILAFVSLFAPLFALGMYNVLLREFAKQPSKIPDIIRTCLVSRLWSGLLLMLVTALVLYWLDGFGAKFQLITVLLIANISNAYEVYERWFQHKSLNRQVVIWRSMSFIFLALVKVVVAYLSQDYRAVIAVIAVELLVKNGGYPWLYRHFNADKSKGHFDFGLFKTIFAQSKFLIFSSLASVIYLKIDILMLEAMVPIEEVGVYAVAARWSEVWYVLPQVVITAMFPKLLNIAKQDPQRYDRILQQGFDILFISALILSAGVYILCPWFIDLLYGEAYQGAVPLLQLHIFASVFIYMRILLSQWLVSERFAQFSLVSQCSGAVTNIALNLWLIPLYGAWGAALATVLSYAMATYFCLIFSARTHKIAAMMTRSMFFLFRLKTIVKLSRK